MTCAECHLSSLEGQVGTFTSTQNDPESLVWAVSPFGSELQGGTYLLLPCCPFRPWEAGSFRSSGCIVWPFPCSLCFRFLPVLSLRGGEVSCKQPLLECASPCGMRVSSRKLYLLPVILPVPCSHLALNGDLGSSYMLLSSLPYLL